MTATEIVLYQEDEERVGTMETLTDAEIVALVNSENNPDCIEGGRTMLTSMSC
jgi:hypothetical protein